MRSKREKTKAGPKVLNEVDSSSVVYDSPSYKKHSRPYTGTLQLLPSLHNPLSIFQREDACSFLLALGAALHLVSDCLSQIDYHAALHGTSVPTSSIGPASSVLPSTSTTAPLPTSSSFYLGVGDTGTPWDGEFLHLNSSGDRITVLLFGPKTPDPYLGDIYFDLDSAVVFQDPDPFVLESYGMIPDTCEIADGVVLCQNGAYSVFYAYPQTVVDGAVTIPYVELGPHPPPPGSFQLSLLPIPLE